MKAHRYFSYQKKDEDFYRCNKLLLIPTLEMMKQSLFGTHVELHESTHIFDSNGGTLSSSIYADFDGDGCIDDVIKLMEVIKGEFNLLPLIYFSGNRGFHIEIPMTIRHPQPHLVSKTFFNTLTNSSFLDEQIYTQRHLLRSDGSVHFKTNLHKTGITYDELLGGMELIRKVSSWQQPNRVEFQRQDPRRLVMFLKGIFQKVNEEIKLKRKIQGSSELSTSKHMTPCLKHLLENEPLDGEWNETITYLGRWFNSRDFDFYSALDVMFEHAHWVEDEGHVRKVFRSIFRDPSNFGCANAEILQRHCCVTCPFNEELYEV